MANALLCSEMGVTKPSAFAAATPVKYERDIKNLAYDLEMLKIFITEKFTQL